MVNPEEIGRNPSKLLAANKSPIEVIGTVTWELALGKQTVPVKFDVSRAINEPILGIVFLFAHECDWNFTDRKTKIAREMIPVQERHAQRPVRWIYASQHVEVPPRSETNVLVHPKRLGWRAHAAAGRRRTSLSNKSQYPALRLINVGQKAYQVSDGQYVGMQRWSERQIFVG